MRRIAIGVFLVILLILGCSFSNAEDSSTEAELEITQSEKVQQILNSIQDDYFVDSVTFKEDSKKFKVVSDYHVRAFEIAKRGEDLKLRNGNVITWEDYINHYINSYFNGGVSGTRFSFEIIDILGEGYTVKEITSNGEIIFIAKDGELIYETINGYVS